MNSTQQTRHQNPSGPHGWAFAGFPASKEEPDTKAFCASRNLECNKVTRLQRLWLIGIFLALASCSDPNDKETLQVGATNPQEGRNHTLSDMNLKLVWIAPGSFLMGSPASEADRSDDETQHSVTLSRGYWLGETEVTQSQWQAIMGSNPSEFSGNKDHPVEQVSWEDCVSFCRKLTQSERAAGRLSPSMEYTLPTEAQWEYACRERGQAMGPFHYGESLNSTQANFDGDYPYGGASKGIYRERTTAVKSFRPNGLGLYDMHGNVWEWCQDWYGGYPTGSVTDPVGPSQGSLRVLHGGGWDSYAQFCRSADRLLSPPSNWYNALGFRLALQHSLGIQ